MLLARQAPNQSLGNSACPHCGYAHCSQRNLSSINPLDRLLWELCLLLGCWFRTRSVPWWLVSAVLPRRDVSLLIQACHPTLPWLPGYVPEEDALISSCQQLACLHFSINPSRGSQGSQPTTDFLRPPKNSTAFVKLHSPQDVLTAKTFTAYLNPKNDKQFPQWQTESKGSHTDHKIPGQHLLLRTKFWGDKANAAQRNRPITAHGLRCTKK